MTDLKLTPTFADTAGSMRVIASHEPLQSEATLPTTPEVAEWKPFPPTPEPRRVAIIGTAPSSRDLAPYNDPSWEIWACSPGNQNVIPRITRWFELHVNLDWPENKHYGLPYIEWLKQQPFPIYMQDKRYVEKAIVFPKDELVKKFGAYFFTSTFAWCMALALHEGVSEIGLYGVDMASRDEYILQRPGGHYFIQKAREMGVKVTIPYESDLEQPPGLYAFSESTPFLRKIHAREAELKGRAASLQQQKDSATQQLTYIQGALEDLDYVKSIWSSAQDGLHLRGIKPEV